MEPILTTKGLTVGYDTRNSYKEVQCDLNLQLYRGELTSLLGVNGVGKSTLLRTLAGFQPLLKGSIVIDGTPIERLSQGKRARMVSVVLTDRVVVGDLFAYEVVALGRHPYLGFFGRLGANDHKVVESMMEAVGIGSFAKRRMSSLSDGERQKVMIAKALAQETPVIILDEPTAFLDLPSRIEITTLLRNLSDKYGKTVLLSTHDLDLALDLSDKLWIMGQDGDRVCGAPEDLVLSGEFNRFFERDKIVFDQEVGRFKFDVPHERSVSLEADAISHFWLKKALHRIGIAVSTDTDSNGGCVRVEDSDTHPYKLTTASNKVLEFETINELLVELKN